MRLKFTREVWLQVVLLVAALGLSFELALHSWLQSGVCPTTDCAVAGEYVRFGEEALVLAGAVFFWVLFLLSFIASRRVESRLWQMILLLMLGALAFDGVLISYQYLELQLVCWLCLAVALALIVALVMLAFVRRTVWVLCLGLAVWVGAGSANALLLFPAMPPALEQTWFMQQQAQKSVEHNQLQLYFFFSMDCGHCTEVMINVASQASRDATWHLCSLDNRQANLQRLTLAMEETEQETDAFSRVLKAKQIDESSVKLDRQVSEDLEERTQKAREFFQARGYRGVPLLVAVQGQSRKVVLQGSKSIAEYLREQDLISHWMRF